MGHRTVEITFPVLNEEETLEQNLLKAWNALQASADRPERFRFIIADNGSKDRTEEIGRTLAAAHSWVRYIRLPAPGVGAALKYSWGASDAEIVGYMDIDLATDLRHVPEAVAAIESGYQICYGSRMHRDSKVLGRKLSRTIISHVFNSVLRNYVGARFSDGMCGFKFIDRKALAGVMARGAVSDGWFFSTELLLMGERLGLQIKELPVAWTDDPNSRVRLFRLTWQYLQAMRIVRARDRVWRYDSLQRLAPEASSER